MLERLNLSRNLKKQVTMNEIKVAFITGANRGLGFETARSLGKNGIYVILGSRSKIHGIEAVKKLQDEGISCCSIPFDVNQTSDHKKIYAHIEKEFGKLDILVNNAAVLLEDNQEDKNLTSSTSEKIIRKTFETNFFNIVTLTQTLLPLVHRSNAGRIVNVSSSLGSLTLHSDPNWEFFGCKMIAYNCSKTALNAFTVHLAHELKETKIKVNSAHPGWVKTEMGGELAPLELEEGVKTSVLLALLPEDGPTGGFYHLEEPLPW